MSDTLKYSLQQRVTEHDGGDVTEDSKERAPSGTTRTPSGGEDPTDEVPEHGSHIYMTEVEGQMPEQDNSDTKLHG